ncbi:hypothetical protein OPW39_15515 [Vibrio europaeus]|uniref:hypothetical protein n=1 Tax=Vibrio europaeus TaxID=300876 RepID=UPI00233EB0D7|nr:hypothetical protein [Vibrio europaeus]MDC5870215.1 hypothetical protein [Vibrio europaeus]
MSARDPHYWSNIIYSVAQSSKSKSEMTSLSSEERMSHALSAEQSTRLATDVREMEMKERTFEEISVHVSQSDQLIKLNEQAMVRSKLNPEVSCKNSLFVRTK